MIQKQGFWNNFRSAVLFITVLPAGRDAVFSPLGMIRYFPLVGILLGALLCLADSLVSRLYPTPVSALVCTILLVILTGAFHLDGLGDTADGIFSHRSRERALEIMKDSRIGMMGLVAVVCVLSLKTAGLYAMKNSLSGFGLLVAMIGIPSLARSGMLFGIRYLDYGRNSAGTGYDLFSQRLPIKDFIWISVPVLMAACLGFRGVVILCGFGVLVFLILGFYKIKMGCITGDMLGAMVEVTEAALFLLAGMGLN
ncbi:MAG: adenosylcobinamide-GDP ribazoletransferase [Pseudomonadota bacterium]